MSTALSISDVGLRLIKAYEGFRPVDVELMSGQRVAGYGHRVMNGESLHLSEKKAEDLLKRDLAPYEAMINDSVFAPLSQGQFDALCSLAFNIGPKKFLESDVVRALNNGRVLDAANGFDVWRKGEINGQSYVVDALVRRRTAEKVLFLRPSLATPRAPRVDLETAADLGLVGVATSESEPILEDSGLVPVVNYPSQNEGEAKSSELEAEIDKETFVERRDANAPAPTPATPMRRRDDKPGGVLTLSEVFETEDGGYDPLVKELDDFILDIKTGGSKSTKGRDIDAEVESDTQNIESLETKKIAQSDDFTDEADVNLSDDLEGDIRFDPSDYIVGDNVEALDFEDLEHEKPLQLTEQDVSPSPIATAAAEVSGRLDALMADGQGGAPEADKKVLPFRSKNSSKLRQDNPLYGSLISEQEDEKKTDEIVTANKEAVPVDTEDTAAQKDSAARYIANNIAPAHSRSRNTVLNFMVVLGMALLGASIGAMMSGFDQRFGSGGEFVSTVCALFGLMISLGSVYYIFKNMRGTH